VFLMGFKKKIILCGVSLTTLAIILILIINYTLVANGLPNPNSLPPQESSGKTEQRKNSYNSTLQLPDSFEHKGSFGWLEEEIVIRNQPLNELKVVADAFGNAHIFWSGRSGDDWVLYHKIKFLNGSWSGTDNFGKTTTNYEGLMDVQNDPSGGIHIVWETTSNGINYRYFNNSQWSKIYSVAYGLSPKLEINNESIPKVLFHSIQSYSLNYYLAIFNPTKDEWQTEKIDISQYYSYYMKAFNYNYLISYENNLEKSFLFQSMIYQQGYWHPSYYIQNTLLEKKNITEPFEYSSYYLAEEIPHSYFKIAQPLLLSNWDGNSHFFYQIPMPDETFQLHYQRKSEDGSWTQAKKISSKLAQKCTITGVIDQNDRISVAWNYVTYDDGTKATLYIRTFSPISNSWGSEIPITAEDAYVQYPHMNLDQKGNVHLVWVAQNDTDVIVYYRKGWVDTDEDGLVDVEETETYGTDPLNPDTDGDMFLDGQEINLGFDPFDPDEDNDTMFDGYEYYNGLNPYVNDTLGDADNDSLLNIEEFLLGTSANNSDTDFDNVDDYNETRVYFSDPLNVDSDGDKIDDGIEVNELGSNPTSIDTDNDTMLDWYEYVYHSVMDILSNDTAADPDGDGLINLYEFQWSTFPNQKDSDLDGLTDYEEVMIWGTKPLEKHTDSDGLVDGKEVAGFYRPLNPGANTTGYVHTNPLFTDSDFDGLNDNVEINNDVALDPNNNDTDGDAMLDSYEYLFGLDGKNQSDKLLDYDEDGLTNYNESLLWTNPFSKDSDGDGFDDLEELSLGINPALADTDGDGLNDFEELIFLHTNATNSDTDGDGLNDYLEVHIYSSNPLIIDSDGDTLIDGVEVYLYHTNPSSRDSDNDLLEDNVELDFHSDPTVIDTDSDGMNDYFEWLYGLDPRTDDSGMDADGDGISNGEEYINHANPLVLDTDNDNLTDFEEIAVYYTLPNVVDTDEDGLSDYTEIKLIFTNPHDLDSDDDSIIDGIEVALGTNPLMEDTDGDGITDGQELIDGTNPLDPDDNKINNRNQLLIIGFISIIGFIILYYSLPVVISKIRRGEEYQWIKEGIKLRQQKSDAFVADSTDKIREDVLELSSSERVKDN